MIDAVLRGTQLPEPSDEDARKLGAADYDPDLRYRVAKDVLEQVYGRPKQRIDHGGTAAPLTLVFPSFVPPQVGQGAVVEYAGELVPGELDPGD